MSNHNRSSDVYAISRSNIGINAGLSYVKYFGKIFGIEVGIEYNNFKNTTEYRGSYRSDKIVFDPNWQAFFPVAECNYTEIRKVQTIDIPILFKINVPVDYEHIDFFMNVGIKSNIVFESKLIRNGTFAYKGAYPTQYENVFIEVENDDDLGFYSKEYKSTVDMPTQIFNYGVYVNGGFKFKITNDYWISFSPYYFFGLNDITKKDYRGDYVNVFNEATPYKLTRLVQGGLKLGLVIQ